MKYEEIIEKIRIKKQRMKWTNRTIGEKSGVNYNTVRNLMAGENIGIYNLLDILEAMDLKIKIS